MHELANEFMLSILWQQTLQGALKRIKHKHPAMENISSTLEWRGHHLALDPRALKGVSYSHQRTLTQGYTNNPHNIPPQKGSAHSDRLSLWLHNAWLITVWPRLMGLNLHRLTAEFFWVRDANTLLPTRRPSRHTWGYSHTPTHVQRHN